MDRPSKKAVSRLLAVLMLVTMCGCHQRSTDKTELVPTPTNGVFTILSLNAGSQEVEVRVSTAGHTDWIWQPGVFPARMSVPFVTIVTVTAQRTGYEPFYEVRTITPSTPNVRLLVVLNEAAGKFGIRPSELPKETSLRPVMPQTRGLPGRPAFSYTAVFPLLPSPPDLVVDEDAKVWWRDEDAYWLIGRIEVAVLNSMRQLCQEASRTDFVEIPTFVADSRSESHASCHVGSDAVLLAYDGRSRARRENVAALTLLPWLVVLRREAVASRR